MTEEEKKILNINEKEITRIQRELNFIYEISNAMRTTLELNEILYVILTGVTAHHGLGFNRAILFLIDHQKRNLIPSMAIGPKSLEHAQKIWDFIVDANQHLDDLIKNETIDKNIKQSALFDLIKNIQIPLKESEKDLIAQCFKNGTLLHLHEDEIKLHKEHSPLLRLLDSKELVVVPLKAKDKVNGIIVADNFYTKLPITNNDIRIFTMLANQAGLAIENSRLFEMVKHKSHTDALTDLWNHGYFQENLSINIEKFKTDKQPISLLLMDIDNFKKLNDQYGHQSGDEVLINVAKILKSLSREIDYVCRYGGEEFSLILTQTTKSQAKTIAERIRKSIEDEKFQINNQKKILNVTVSIGVATFNEDATSKEELIQQADKAMYIAKFSGKNQTVLASNS